MLAIRIPRPLTLLAVTVVVACTSGPTIVCGCSPPPDEAVVYGRVTLPGGGAAAGAAVRVEIGPAGCQPFADRMEAVANGGGGYRTSVYKPGGYGYGPDACQRVFALPPAGSALRGSDTVPLVVQFRAAPPLDSVRVDLALRAP